MIREYTKNDIDSINKYLFNFDYKLTDDDLNNEFKNILVYLDNNKIIGILVYDFIYDRIEIDYIFVDENYRRMNIATRLINYMESKCENIKNITLEVRESNKSAINFYKKNGFVEVTIRKNYYKNENGILMIKSGD